MKILFLICTFFTFSIHAQELDNKLEELRTITSSIESTIKKYNKFGHRKAGFKILSEQKIQLSKLIPQLEALSFQLKLDNKKMKVEVATQASEIRRLRRYCSSQCLDILDQMQDDESLQCLYR